MTDLNSITEIGRLTSDIGENNFSYLPNGTAKINFTIAVNRSYKGGNGEWVEEPNFFDVVAFGKFAEGLKARLFKGCQVGVSGELRQDRWKDNNGNNRSKVYIVASSVEVLTRNQNGQSNTQSNGYQNDGYGQGEMFGNGYQAPFGN